MHKRILIMVPTFNESGNIEPLVEAVHRALTGTSYAAQFLFLDDESTDGTSQQIANLTRTRSDVHLLTGKRYGLGKAYLRGLRHAQTMGPYYAVVTMDADLSHNPQYIPALLTELERGADLALGSRYIAGGGSDPGYSRYRFILSRLAIRLVGSYAPVADRTSGFRAITTAALTRLDLDDFTANGYFFAAEFIHNCHRNKLKISEIPIVFRARERGHSKLRPADMLEFLRLAYRYNPLSPSEKVVVHFGLLWLFFLAVSLTQLDPDFGWHLSTGNYVLAHGLPAHDIYTFTARSFPWINHEWGNDVILATLYRFGGYNLAAILYAALWAGCVYLGGRGKARLVTLLLAAVALTSYAGSRPLAWTAFFFAATLAIMRNPDRRLRWLLPVAFLIWANVHAGFIAGLALLAYFAVWERQIQSVALLFACFAATFANGYGPRLYTEIFRTVGDPYIHERVQEWNSFYIPTTAWLFCGLWLAGFIWLRPRRASTARFRLPSSAQLQHWFGLNPLLMTATLSATRNLPLFTASAIPAVDQTVGALQQLVSRLEPRGRKIVFGLSAFLGLILAASMFALYAPGLVHREGRYPSQAVSYLEARPCSGNTFNSFLFGGYLIWKLPGRPVYIDGRMPTWEPYMTTYLNVTSHPAKYAPAEFKRYNIRCAVLKTGLDKPLIQFLTAQHWRTVVDADESRLMLAPRQ